MLLQLIPQCCCRPPQVLTNPDGRAVHVQREPQREPQPSPSSPLLKAMSSTSGRSASMSARHATMRIDMAGFDITAAQPAPALQQSLSRTSKTLVPMVSRATLNSSTAGDNDVGPLSEALGDYDASQCIPIDSVPWSQQLAIMHPKVSANAALGAMLIFKGLRVRMVSPRLEALKTRLVCVRV